MYSVPNCISWEQSQVEVYEDTKEKLILYHKNVITVFIPLTVYFTMVNSEKRVITFSVGKKYSVFYKMPVNDSL